jgi:hypothetical protein
MSDNNVDEVSPQVESVSSPQVESVSSPQVEPVKVSSPQVEPVKVSSLQVEPVKVSRETEKQELQLVLESIKEPHPDDSIIVPINKVTEKIEVKPENVLIDGIEHLYCYIKTVHDKKITPLNVVVIATELMQIVEKYNNLTGVQKKMLVINVIKKVVNNQVDSPEEKAAINLIIDVTLPIVIDNLVSAMNGTLTFNKEKAISFFKKIFFCCNKN